VNRRPNSENSAFQPAHSRRRGRRPLPLEARRQASINVRFSEREIDLLHRLALRQQTPTAVLVREVVLRVVGWKGTPLKREVHQLEIARQTLGERSP
jgi:hypothetical protein